MAVQGTVIHRPWVRKVAALMLVGCGLFLLKLCVLDVLADARAHAPEVSLSFKGVLIAPAMLGLGFFAGYSVFSGKPRQSSDAVRSRFRNPATNKLTASGWLVGILCLAPGALLYFWLRTQLRELGYDF